MPSMGRKRSNPDAGLEPRVYANHGSFYYVHRDGRWQNLGKDRELANHKARVFNDPAGMYGTVVHFMDLFLLHCEERVRAGTMAARTLDDYRSAIEVNTLKRDAGDRKAGQAGMSGALRVFFAPPMTPLDVTPQHVQLFLATGAQAGRAKRANRERACLGSFFSWLITSGKVPGLAVNPCMRASGVTRNPESKRERYVTHDEYRAVWAVATRSERLLMELTYRTLQRPESDIILWTTAHVVVDGGRRVLDFVQHKTGRRCKIALSTALDELLPKPSPSMSNVLRLREPLVRTLKGQAYSYDGISSMLKRSIAAANKARAQAGQAPIASFGYRDLKGKGATDMWLAGVPIEQIQQLLGHASKTTTEIYIKQRWQETSEVNQVVM